MTWEGDTSHEQPCVLTQSIFCPEILSSKTCDSPSWALLRATKNHSKSAFLAVGRQAFRHALKCFTKDETLEQKALSKHSTQGRHCCTDSRAASYETAHGMASNMASALGTNTDVWRCPYLSSCKGRKLRQIVQNGLQPASSINQFGLCFSYISIMYCYLWHEGFF